VEVSSIELAPLATGLTGIGALRDYIDQFWNQALAAFKVAAERDDEEEDP
jgi:hypothetical protein